MILVTDATSRIGASVVRHLSSESLRPRALVPSRARATRFESMPVELEVGTLANPRDVQRALEGVSVAVLVTSFSPEQVAHQEQFIQLAQKAGVKRLVKLSAIGASADASCDSARWHWRIEQLLQRSGIPAVSVRATRLMQTLELQVPMILTASCFTGCQGHARIADIDARDVATILARLAQAAMSNADQPLLEGDLPRSSRMGGGAGGSTDVEASALFETVEITGPQALSRQEMAAILSEQFGRAINYIDCAPAELLQCANAAGFPGWQAHDLVSFDTDALRGAYSEVSAATARLLGRPPRDFAAFAHELAFSVRYASAPVPASDQASVAMMQ